MLKFTIITINLNNANGLQKTIESVVTQTFSDYEYIIIDGGSNDGSVDVIKRYADKISYWVSEKDNGIYHAMNKGIVKANGEFCLFLNSGDYFDNKNVLQQVFDEKSNSDIIYGDMIIDLGNGNYEYGTQPSTITFEFLIADTLWHPVSFIRKELFDTYGLYNEAHKIISDYEFFLKTIIVEGVSTHYLHKPISVFNVHGIGSDKEFDKLHQAERLAAQQKYFPIKAIESAKQFNELKKSKAVRTARWIAKFPVLKKILLFIYNTFLMFRKGTSK